MCGIFQTICQIISPDKVRSKCWQFKKRSKITCRKLIMENEFSLFFFLVVISSLVPYRRGWGPIYSQFKKFILKNAFGLFLSKFKEFFFLETRLFSRLYFDFFFSRNLTSLISHYNDFNLDI